MNAQTLKKQFQTDALGSLSVRNFVGNLSIHGWNRSFIEVEILKKDQISGDIIFPEIIFRRTGSQKRLSFALNPGTDLRRKQSEAKKCYDKFEFRIFAPSTTDLEVFTSEQGLSVRDWIGKVELFSGSGGISLRNFRGTRATAKCDSCNIEIGSSSGHLEISSQHGRVNLDNLENVSLNIETKKGAIAGRTIEGNVQISNQSGSVNLESITGEVSFQQASGGIEMRKLNGRASGSTTSGNIFVEAIKWRGTKNEFFETIKGNIHVVLNDDFEGDVLTKAPLGHVTVKFALNPNVLSRNYGPEDPGLRSGRVGKKNHQGIFVISDKGRILLEPLKLSLKKGL